MAVVRLEAIAPRGDDALGVLGCIGVALRPGVDLGIEVEAGEERPGSSLVGTAVASSLRR